MGISHTAYSLKVPIQNTKNKKEKKKDEKHDEEYRPKEVEEFQDSVKKVKDTAKKKVYNEDLMKYLCLV